MGRSRELRNNTKTGAVNSRESVKSRRLINMSQKTIYKFQQTTAKQKMFIKNLRKDIIQQ